MLRCMRTTITIDDGLLDDVRRRAVERGTTVSRVIEDSVRESLARATSPEPDRPFRLTTFRGDGLQPGVDLDDNTALLELMDSAE